VSIRRCRYAVEGWSALAADAGLPAVTWADGAERPGYAARSWASTGWLTGRLRRDSAAASQAVTEMEVTPWTMLPALVSHA
jgi:hypothetical protein